MAVKEVKLCLLGESGVGKSSIVQRFVTDQFRPAMESTIGASFMTKNIEVSGKTYKFQIWDTAGQEKYRALAPMYYRGSAAAIVVYDITREVQTQDAEKYAEDNGSFVVETSAKTAVNIASLFVEIAKRLPAEDMAPSRVNNSRISLHAQSDLSSRKRKCCSS